MITLASLAIMSDHIKIAYEDMGYGFPLVFIHGWAATRNFWNPIRDLENYRIILFDLRGHGESDRSKKYTFDRIMLDVNELLAGLGIRELSIIGHSLGGIIATKFASMFTDYNVRKLILVATPPVFKMSFARRLFTGFMLLFLNPLMRKMFTPKTLYEPKEDILKFIWSESAKGSKIAYIKYLKAFNNTSIIEDLEEIKAEKIAIIPSHDKIVSTEIQKETYFSLCDRTIIIENSGHNVMLERPDEFRRALLEALGE